VGGGILTCDFRFIRCDSQPIELPLKDNIHCLKPMHVNDFPLHTNNFRLKTKRKPLTLMAVSHPMSMNESCIFFRVDMHFVQQPKINT
jgi:hypothetical protein